MNIFEIIGDTVLCEAPIDAHLYHATTLRALPRILDSNQLVSQRGNFISLTRNPRFWGWNNEQIVRLTLDSAVVRQLAARQGLRIGPIEEPRFTLSTVTRRGNIDEREERIYGSPFKNVRAAILNIDVKKSRQEHDWQGDAYCVWVLHDLSRLQKTYRIPFNYDGEPLVRRAAELRWFLDPRYANTEFWGGPYRKTYDERGQKNGRSVHQILLALYRNLGLSSAPAFDQ